ncbi:organic cation/carnitine transporter 7 [Cocos nucifera]|uniref:Organic cation/carnitine transporter 7 n=1 Tax=Cocos nucifera TaxID=13894 RepID=A0A8K0IRD0_COCNU|nr:organic cation/carnitine transporter 7 [Cocos nucifera]
MGDGTSTYTVDEALMSLGFGKFQVLVLAYAGMGWISEAMEMMLLSFVGPAVQSEWKLSSHQESLITSVVFGGMLLGAYSWGVVSDNYGRRQVIMPKFGWRWLLALSSLPSFLLLVFYAVTPESPRYLCMKGRTVDAVHVLEKVAILNHVSLPSGMLTSDHRIELDEIPNPSGFDLDENPNPSEATHLVTVRKKSINEEDMDSKIGGISSFFRLLSPRLVRSTLLLWMVFFGNAFSYYGIVLLTSELSNGNRICTSNEMQSSHSNNGLYKDVFIASFAEIPGLVLSAAIVDRIGRKLSMSAMLFISCIFLFPLAFHQTEALTTALLFGARICISGSFTVVYVYAPEAPNGPQHVK